MGGCATEGTNSIPGHDGSDECDTTECSEACRLAGYEAGGFCVEGECICEGIEKPDAGEDAVEDPIPDDGHTTGSCDIDILFVIDTSGSMFDAAKSLREVGFPSFIQQLEEYSGLGTYRVAVTNHLYGQNPADSLTVDDSLFLTVGYDPNYECQNLADGCDSQGHEYEELAGGYGYYLCDDVPEMAHTVGCSFASGQTWMEGPSTALLDEFLCVGNIACHQSESFDEPTLRAGVEALRYSGNQDFLRQEALLVLVYLTDEEDSSEGMTYQQMHDEILALKGGDERYVVVVTMAGPEVGTEELNIITHEMGCTSELYGAVYETPRIIGFTGLFGARGRHYNLCEDDLSTALTDALDRLEMSCAEILI